MTTTEERGFQPGGFVAYEIESFEIAQWTPDPEGLDPPTQVHFIIRIRGLDTPLVARFKGPETLRILIQQLKRHFREVWPKQKEP